MTTPNLRRSGQEQLLSEAIAERRATPSFDGSPVPDEVLSVILRAGLESPSGNEYRLGGFTGTELANGHKVSRGEARSGDLVIYLRYPGDRTGSHVEVLDDPVAGTTIGHGDAAINRGRIDLFGNGLYEIRTYH